MRKSVEFNWLGLDVSAVVVFGDSEGDPAVGVHHLPPYPEDIEILSPGGDDLYEHLNEETIDYLCERLIAAARERY